MALYFSFRKLINLSSNRNLLTFKVADRSLEKLITIPTQILIDTKLVYYDALLISVLPFVASTLIPCEAGDAGVLGVGAMIVGAITLKYLYPAAVVAIIIKYIRQYLNKTLYIIQI